MVLKPENDQGCAVGSDAKLIHSSPKKTQAGGATLTSSIRSEILIRLRLLSGKV